MMVRRRGNRTVGWSQNDVHSGAFNVEGLDFSMKAWCFCVFVLGCLCKKRGGGGWGH